MLHNKNPHKELGDERYGYKKEDCKNKNSKKD